MSSRLDCITDWDDRLRRAGWRADALARSCRISQRELRRYIRARFGQSVREWMESRQMKLARALLREGIPAKEVSLTVGYRETAHFSRSFKRVHGMSPSVFARHPIEFDI